MRILLHCNAGPTLGIGHVMRSIALAEEAIAAGHRVVLAGEVEGEFVRRRLDAVAGLELTLVRRPAGDALRDLLRRLDPDVVHVDTYDLDVDPSSWIEEGRPLPLLSNMEDGTFGRRAADLAVDPNLGAEDAPAAGSSTWLLRGARYTPLRRAVVEHRGGWAARPVPCRVLVVMGGTDPMRLTAPALELLGRTGLTLEVTAVVAGEAAGPCADVAAEHPQLDVRLVLPLEDLPAAMAGQDLVISAAGTSVWELCCLGVPTALVCTVENQRLGYDRIVSAGAALGLGSSAADLLAEPTVERLRDVLRSLAARRSISDRASRIIDGLGAWRVVAAWEQLVREPPSDAVETLLEVRAADLSDARSLWQWRNDPTTRANSLQQDEVAFEDHLRWLGDTLGRDDRILLVAADGAGDVGTVRWDRVAEQEWEVSITVAPTRRGQALSRSLLAAGERELLRRAGPPATAVALVQERNAASRRLFETSAYLPDRPTDGRGVLTYAKQLTTAGPRTRSGPRTAEFPGARHG